MSDIVDRLRRLTKQGEDYIWRPAVDAIAEIERLRDALEKADDALHDGEMMRAIEIIRSAVPR